MRWSVLAASAVAFVASVSLAETYQMDFGPPGQVEYAGKDYGAATNVSPTKTGETGDNYVLKGVEYKLGSATLSAEKIGAFSVDGESTPQTADSLTKSFFFANADNPDVGAVVELKLTGVKPTDKVTFAFINSAQKFAAVVTVKAGEKTETKDVNDDTEFVTFSPLTGADTYTISFTHPADKPGEANIAGARITIEAQDPAPAGK